MAADSGLSNDSHITLNGAQPTNGVHKANGVHSTNGEHKTNGVNGDHEIHGAYASNNDDNLIAICGMALRLPGGLTSPQEFWEFLLSKGDARTRVPPSRYNADAYHSQAARASMVRSVHGYFLNDEISDPRSYDAAVFNIPRAEIQRADPHQRMMLEVARECFEDAGFVDWAGSRTGCYMGSFGEDWCEMFAKDPQQYGLYRVTGYGDFMLSNRVSYELDLKGPSMTIRTGCSAALVGLHEACRALQNGDCDAALVGGANLILAPGMTTAMTEQGVLATDGACKTFSADANGYGRGEAINAILIKPLHAALRDGNPIRAVIRSTATNSDGRTQGISLPSGPAQEALMRHAYSSVGLPPALTPYVELHGTGTPIGDPIESNAVGRVFGENQDGRKLYITSVKPNMGHSEGASGLTSLIKVVLSLEKQTILPNIRFTTPNPSIGFEEFNMVVPVEATPWPEGSVERASINSFGIGGSNAHAILESAASLGVARSPKARGCEEQPRLLLLSAASQTSVQRAGEAYTTLLAKNSHNLADLSYTLANRREHLAYRTFAVARPDETPTLSAIQRAPTTPPNLVYVFTGQGAQWPRMGADLYRTNEVFKATIDRLDTEMKQLPNPTPWGIADELLKDASHSQVGIAEFAQPLTTAVQIGLVDTFASLNLKPAAVLGHSSGEVAAAYAAGALSSFEALAVAVYRGLVTKRTTRVGAMAALGLGAEDAQKFLTKGVVIACENSPSSTTISGDAEAVEKVVAAVAHALPDVLARKLKVDQAYHSHHMVEVGETYFRDMKGLVKAAPAAEASFFSSVSGRLLTKKEVLGPRYWQRNLESPVLFRTALAEFLNSPLGKNAAYLEIGPHAALAGPVRQTLSQSGVTAPYIAAMNRSEDSAQSLLSAIGKLHQLNLHIDFLSLVPDGECIPDLPRYPWDHSRLEDYWYESRLSKNWRMRDHTLHELLGFRTLESTDIEPSWRNLLQLDSPSSWIRDHRIGDDIIFPFAGYTAMAGEAVRQLTSEDHGFALRQVIVSTALVVVETHPVEMITTLRRHRLTDDVDSEWWEFVISSTNGSVWTKHCTGQVTALHSISGSCEDLDRSSFPRRVETKRWYDTLARSGLNYGSRFQGLDSMRAATTENKALATIEDTQGDDASQYFLHPSALDSAIQLSSVAQTRGVNRKLHDTWIPVRIESLQITRCTRPLLVMATSAEMKGGTTSCDIKAISDGRLMLSVQGMVLAPLRNTVAPAKPTTHTTARVEWNKHIDFLDSASLIKPSVDRTAYTPLLDQLTALAATYSYKVLTGRGASALPHMNKFRQWIADYVEESQPQLQNLSTDQIDEKIRRVRDELEGTPASVAGEAIDKVRMDLLEVFINQLEPFQVLTENDLLSRVRDFNDGCDNSQFLHHLSHTNPNLRILEIGAGAGTSTAKILKNLIRHNGPGLYSQYTYTDISADLLAAAEQRFAKTAHMAFATLDVSKDPLEQGFEAGQYDLIIATNVLHATETLAKTLANVHKLLHPKGRLLLQEVASTSKWINFIFGLLPDWWLGEADGRPQEPYVDPKRWMTLFKEAGFQGVATPVFDSPMPYQLNAIYVASPSPLSDVVAEQGSALTLLVSDVALVPRDLVEALEQRGYRLDVRSLRDGILMDQDTLVVLDYLRPFFDHLSASNFALFQKLVQSIGEAGMLWLTKPSQMKSIDPRHANILGAARSIRSELDVDLATCEFDWDKEVSWSPVVDVLTHFLAARREAGSETGLRQDYEYAIDNGHVNVGRYHPFSIEEESALQMVAEGEKAITLSIGKPGLISSLEWSHCPIKPLADNDVEVEVYGVGLNFRDVLATLGVVKVSKDGLGLELSGVIRNKGKAVTSLDVGDRVIALAGPAFSTTVVAPARLCQRVPDGLDFNDAATMPCVYATSIYSLFNVGNLQRGQSILIHSACGGVGLAAIQLAQMVGATIYATVSNDEKIFHLMETFGIPQNHIFNSRDDSFVADLRRETNGQGVDLVLNSLSGELLHASWQCVAEFGKMIEIGKKDILGGGRLDMSPFLANRSYCCVDLDEICKKKPELCSSLLGQLVDFYRAGHIQPIQPIKVFSASVVQDAFRYMQKGQHLGKIVVTMRQNAVSHELKDDERVRPDTLELSFDGDASYLLVGGLGGLGRSTASWMLEHGARHFIFLSRSAGSSTTDKDFVTELESHPSCTVQLVKGSVTEYNDVFRAIDQPQRPIKGIFQMSMVLRDQAFLRMTHSEWIAAEQPKVMGTWNLHHALGATGQKVDFFVLFSSVSATMGQPGQANYNSANTFLTSFAQYRKRLGLSASVVDIGAMEEVGHIADNETLLRQVKTSAAYALREQELLDALALAIVCGKPRLAETAGGVAVSKEHFVLGLCSTVPLRSAENRALWRKDRRMAVYHNTTDEMSGETGSAKGAMDSEIIHLLARARGRPDVLASPEFRHLVAIQIGKKLLDMLLRPVEELDTKQSLSDLGMDSLVAIEMRSWWKQVFRTDISVLEMLGSGTLEALGNLAVDKLA